MTERARRARAAGFKAKVALAAIKGEKTLAGSAQRHDAHPSRVTAWKGRLVEAAPGLSGSGGAASGTPPAIDVKALRAKIGGLALEDGFSSGAPSKADLLGAKRWSTGPMTCRWRGRRRFCGPAGAASAMNRGPCQGPDPRSCGGSTPRIWATRSRAAGC